MRLIIHEGNHYLVGKASSTWEDSEVDCCVVEINADGLAYLRQTYAKYLPSPRV